MLMPKALQKAPPLQGRGWGGACAAMLRHGTPTPSPSPEGEGRFRCKSSSPMTTASTPPASRCWRNWPRNCPTMSGSARPAEEQSGAGHSLTLHMPVRLREHGGKRYSVTGTPTDSVNLALRKLFPDKLPDLVISGVNAGENLGDDMTYSGTISAAIEAALAGIPAIALSQAFRDNGPSFAATASLGQARARTADRHGDGAAHADQRQLPRPACGQGARHPRGAAGVPRLRTRHRWSKARTRAGGPITGSACRMPNTPSITAPIWKRWRTAISPSPRCNST